MGNGDVIDAESALEEILKKRCQDLVSIGVIDRDRSGPIIEEAMVLFNILNSARISNYPSGCSEKLLDQNDFLFVLSHYYEDTRIPQQLYNALRRYGIDTMENLIDYVNFGTMRQDEIPLAIWDNILGGNIRRGYIEGREGIRKIDKDGIGLKLSVALYTYLNHKKISIFPDGYRRHELKAAALPSS